MTSRSSLQNCFTQLVLKPGELLQRLSHEHPVNRVVLDQQDSHHGGLLGFLVSNQEAKLLPGQSMNREATTKSSVRPDDDRHHACATAPRAAGHADADPRRLASGRRDPSPRATIRRTCPDRSRRVNRAARVRRFVPPTSSQIDGQYPPSH